MAEGQNLPAVRSDGTSSSRETAMVINVLRTRLQQVDGIASTPVEPVGGPYAPLVHDHDGRYALIAHNHDATYAMIAHSHPSLLPSGGTVGQVLTKTSGSDFASSWQTPASGGGGVFSLDAGNAAVRTFDPVTFNLDAGNAAVRTF